MKLDRFLQWLVNSILPKRLIYWAFIRGAAIASQGEYANTDPSKLDVMTAMGRIDKDCRGKG